MQAFKAIGSFLNPIAPPVDSPVFIPPPPKNRVTLGMSLHNILPGVDAKIEQAQAMVFHAVSDTGGVRGTEIQEALAAIEDARANHQPAEEPLFFYHLGSVVFFDGLSADYAAQFYEPYQHYEAPIFAIAGNHDGDTRTRIGAVPNDEPQTS
jgi:hypothetical protein